ncbi:hypothetical protein SDC9_148834 [bioreactor metagenome]|uniref:Uncharacterized protein n=1 Tax=bioreactor metagenome TaxID=1076179 RepID=A0A645ELS9_9ZZZZ
MMGLNEMVVGMTEVSTEREDIAIGTTMNDSSNPNSNPIGIPIKDKV